MMLDCLSPLYIIFWISFYHAVILAKPIKSKNNAVCIPELTIPTFSGECVPLCRTIQQARPHCKDSVTCLCQRTPPPMIRDCLQCVINAMGNSDYVFAYAVSSQHQLEAYSALCGIQLQSPLQLPHRHDQTLYPTNLTTNIAHDIVCVGDVPRQPLVSFYYGKSSFIHHVSPYLSFIVGVTLALISQLVFAHC